MGKKTFKIISAKLAATLTMHLEENTHIDLCTEFDKEYVSTDEVIAVQHSVYFGTSIYLMGGYGAGVRMVNKPPTVSDSDKVIHSEITSKLVEFLEVGESFAIETAQLNDFPVGIFSKQELTELANAESIVLHG